MFSWTKKDKGDQGDLFRSRLDQILDWHHPLFILVGQINFEGVFGSFYMDKVSCPGQPIHLRVRFHYLRHAYNESDESVMVRLLANPLGQLFCGIEFFIYTRTHFLISSQ